MKKKGKKKNIKIVYIALVILFLVAAYLASLNLLESLLSSRIYSVKP